MAVNRLETSDSTPRTKVLSNGAIYDLDKGRIVANPGGGKHAITSDNAKEFLARRREVKQETIAAAANEAVQSNTTRGKYGGQAWIAEIASVQMMIATTPDAGQAATKAADWLITNAGLGERQRDEGGGVSAVVHTIDPAVMSLLAQIAQAQDGNAFDNSNYHNHVIEAEASTIEDAEGGQGEGG